MKCTNSSDGISSIWVKTDDSIRMNKNYDYVKWFFWIGTHIPYIRNRIKGRYSNEFLPAKPQSVSNFSFMPLRYVKCSASWNVTSMIRQHWQNSHLKNSELTFEPAARWWTFTKCLSSRWMNDRHFLMGHLLNRRGLTARLTVLRSGLRRELATSAASASLYLCTLIRCFFSRVHERPHSWHILRGFFFSFCEQEPSTIKEADKKSKIAL